MQVRTWIYKFFRNPRSVLFTAFKRMVEHAMVLCGMSIKCFYFKDTYPWLQYVEDNYEAIKAEMQYIYSNNLVPSVQDVNKNVSTYSDDDKWKTFILWVYGNKIEKNCALCPNTVAVIQKIPNFYTAFFSILEPGKEIKRHRGVYRGNTLMHLALVVPQPYTACTFHVGDQSHHWQEGQAFVFEDSYYHYVSNTAHTYRAVLIVEFRRDVPKLLQPLDSFIQKNIRNSYITKNILNKLN